MQPTTTTDITVDSTAPRLPYAAPTLEELSSAATAGGKGDPNPELSSGGS